MLLKVTGVSCHNKSAGFVAPKIEVMSIREKLMSKYFRPDHYVLMHQSAEPAFHGQSSVLHFYRWLAVQLPFSLLAVVKINKGWSY